eukprot:3361987-Prorocentrum_lima.AAC.1
MTSSLVGSEMCIRDRGTTSVRGVEDRPRKQTRVTRRHIVREGNPFAVSYTHLTLPTICSV